MVKDSQRNKELGAGLIDWRGGAGIRERESTKCFLISLKCTKFVSVWSSAPDPAGGAYSSPPEPLAGFGYDRDGL